LNKTIHNIKTILDLMNLPARKVCNQQLSRIGPTDKRHQELTIKETMIHCICLDLIIVLLFPQYIFRETPTCLWVL